MSSRSAVDRGVTRLSGIPARAGSSSDALARDRTTAPCPLPQAARAPAELCAGLLQAQSPGPSSTTTSPSARKASTAACCSSTGGASTTTSRARRGISAKPCFVALTSASVRSSTRSRPTSTRNRARCDSSACFARKARARSVLLGTSAGPGLAQRACEREQYRARRERDHRACVTHDITARVHDERP